jgi:hypothetical protein
MYAEFWGRVYKILLCEKGGSIPEGAVDDAAYVILT